MCVCFESMKCTSSFKIQNNSVKLETVYEQSMNSLKACLICPFQICMCVCDRPNYHFANCDKVGIL